MKRASCSINLRTAFGAAARPTSIGLAIASCALVACKSSPPARPTPPDPVVQTLPTAPTPIPPKAENPPVQTVAQTATPQELVFPEEDFRATQPAAGAVRPFRLPKIKPFTLKSGIKVFLVE